jgi:hypothetical protein
MLSKFRLVQNVHLTCDEFDLERLAINGRRGQIDLSDLRHFLGKQLLREVLLHFHGVKPDSLESVQARLKWRIRLLARPSRISFSYGFDKAGGKQAKQFRILFASERVPRVGYRLTTERFRRGDEA